MHRWLGIGVVVALAFGTAGLASGASGPGGTPPQQQAAVPSPPAPAEPALAGTTAATGSSQGPVVPPGRCDHPHPCDDVWPDGLTESHGGGCRSPRRPRCSFELRDVYYGRLPVPADRSDPSAGTIEIEHWVGMPDLPPGVKAPVLLVSSPYLVGPNGDSPAEDSFWTDTPGSGAIRNWGVNPIDLVRAGYAVVFASVRGTGNSGGCFDLFGREEQLDQLAILDWLGSNPIFNGRVAMGGLSYRSVPAIAAAARRHPALKTIVVSGTVFDMYTGMFTPQGAIRLGDGPAFALPFAVGSAAPVGDPVTAAETTRVPPRTERLCPDLVEKLTPGRDWLVDDRDAGFWRERSFLRALPHMTASILLAQGFRDVLSHGFQDGPVWASTPLAPKRQVTGQWAHAYPWPAPEACAEGDQREACGWFEDAGWGGAEDEWHEILLTWLDYWLKGEGRPPRLGTADYQDGQGTWHASSAWPPADMRQEVLYLTGDDAAPLPGGDAGSRTARPLPTAMDRRTFEWHTPLGSGTPWPVQPWTTMCPDPVSQAAKTTGPVYVSAPLAQDTLLAGNPFALLDLSADQPGGTVRVQVAEIVGGDVRCDAAGQPENVRILTAGAADLRFHDRGFAGRDFAGREHVRVDMWDLAETIPAGSRLAVVVMGAEPADEWTGQPYQPELTIHAGGVTGSQVVLPVVSGTTGGSGPRIDYPARPFVGLSREAPPR